MRPCTLAPFLLLFASSTALAQPRRSDPAAATALFDQARELAAHGDFAAACPKFEASLELFPSASTMIHIARCHERAGRTASAWWAYGRALVLNAETQEAERQKALEEIARQGGAAVEAKVPHLRIVIRPKPRQLTVTRDGLDIPVQALGDALPTDPGTRTIVAGAPGFETETRTVVLSEGKLETLEIVLRPRASTDGATAPIAPSPDAPRGVPTWAYVAGGLGVASVGASIGFGIDGFDAAKALRTRCFLSNGVTRCEPGYDFAGDNARKNRDVPLAVGFGATALVGLGAAAYGVLSRPRTATSARGLVFAPWFAAEGRGAFVAGTF